jgi:hypothetical protein
LGSRLWSDHFADADSRAVAGFVGGGERRSVAPICLRYCHQPALHSTPLAGRLGATQIRGDFRARQHSLKVPGGMARPRLGRGSERFYSDMTIWQANNL